MQLEQTTTDQKNIHALMPALSADTDAAGRTAWYATAMERLVGVIQDLSHARDLDSVMTIVRRAARMLTGADGATFVLRDGDKCYYADEDAISPLWKGQRFPMSACISGWVMLNKQPVVIEDIFKDPRIPADAYRPTFVKSLAMVPIRAQSPVGAIGNYWSHMRQPTQEEVAVLQALANVTSVTMENIDLYQQLQGKVRALEKSNEDLTRFAWIASHDLKSPLRAIHNLSQWLEDDAGAPLSGKSREHLDALRKRVRRMERLLDSILEYARLENEQTPQVADIVSGAELEQDIRQLVNVKPGFHIETSDSFKALKLPRNPLEQILSNLVDNAIKHHDRDTGRVELHGGEENDHYFLNVTDDGPGIAPEFHDRIFEMFQTLKPRDKTEGSGMGLALVKKQLMLYRGEIFVISTLGAGTTFSIRFPKEPQPNTAQPARQKGAS